MPGASDADFSSMRTLVYGASPITEAVLVGSMALFGCDFVQAYGLTETTGGVVQLDPEDHDPGGDRAHLLRAAGKPWGDVELRIVDAETGRRRGRRRGRRGVGAGREQVMKGYWKNPRPPTRDVRSSTAGSAPATPATCATATCSSTTASRT